MDRILKILKKENGPRASSAPALELNTIIFKHVYWYMQLISGERLQDHWSSGYNIHFSLVRIKFIPKSIFLNCLKVFICLFSFYDVFGQLILLYNKWHFAFIFGN